MPTFTEKKKIAFVSQEHLVNAMKSDKKFMEGIRKGVADCIAGRVRPWEEVQK